VSLSVFFFCEKLGCGFLSSGGNDKWVSFFLVSVMLNWDVGFLNFGGMESISFPFKGNVLIHFADKQSWEIKITVVLLLCFQ